MNISLERPMSLRTGLLDDLLFAAFGELIAMRFLTRLVLTAVLSAFRDKSSLFFLLTLLHKECDIARHSMNSHSDQVQRL